MKAIYLALATPLLLMACVEEQNPAQSEKAAENEEDVRRCLEAIKRKRLKAAFSDEFDNEKNRLDLAENIHLLKNERVVFESKEAE